MRIAITGNEGFLGKHLVKALSKVNNDLSLFDRKIHDLFYPKTLESFLKGADIVIHLASLNRASNPALIRTNVVGTAGLLEGMQKFSPMAKIIFSSSFQVYHQKSTYALSKRLAEETIGYFSREVKIASIILRISNIYGPGCKPFYNSVIATFVHQVKNNTPITINRDGEQKRDYIFVKDVIRAIEKAIQYNPKKNIESFDICSGTLVSLNEIIKKLEAILGTKVKVSYKAGVQSDKWNIKKDYNKTEKELSWKPNTSLYEGLKLTLKEI